MFKRFLSLALAFCMIMSCFIGIDCLTINTAAETTDYGLADDVQDGQILQCWNWSFNNIKNNMATIASQGFSAIQTSPIQAAKESTKESWSTAGNSFWVYYQPISFNIETATNNALGTKSEFEAMCEEAHKYGVKVIVDTVFNHLANENADNTLSSLIASDIKDDSSCWHSVTTNISNYSDRYDITHNCLSGLPDLNTGNSKIQNYAISFLKECIDAGADGFRFDAAKHIETPSDASGTSSDFWPNVLNSATSYAQSSRGITPYYYGELLDSTGGVDITAYTTYMSVTDNQGSNNIRNAVNSGNSGSAANSYIQNGAQPKYTVQWNESHDTYADDSSSYVSDTNLKKTWAMVGARAEVCGMYLARPSSDSTMLGAADVTAWADKEVKAINQFKNAFIGQTEYFASSGSIAYNERGTSGVVMINVNGSSTSVSVTANRMADGTYTDAISGNTFTVSNGTIKGNIGDTGIAVVYNPSEVPTVTTPTTSEDVVTGDTKTVYVGVIEYITTTPTLHYWNSSGLTGDATLTATGETVSFSVGSSYWSNAAQTFNVYKATIPAEATGYKTYDASSNSNWAAEDITYAKDTITLVFEWGGTYHNVTETYVVEEPTVAQTDPTEEETVEVTEPTEEPTEEPTVEPTVEETEPTEVETVEPTEETPTGDKTVYVGVIKYITTVPTLHYWNYDGLAGDSELTATGETAEFSVGSSYWSNEAKTFYIYKTTIPAEATDMKTYDASSNSNWASESVSYAENTILLVFEWGGVYHNLSEDYVVEEPTEAPTTEETVIETEAPTAEPTVQPTTDVTEAESAYILCDGVYYKVEKGQTFTYTFNISLDSSVSISSIDVVTLYDTDGLDFAPTYDENGEDDVLTMFPYLSGVVYNYNIDGEIYYNYTSLSGAKLANNSVVFQGTFTVTADSGVYEINTMIKDMADSDGNIYVYNYEKLVDFEETQLVTDLTPVEDETEEPTVAPTVTEGTKVENITTEVTSTTIKFNWDEVEGATKYWVYQYSEKYDTWTSVASAYTNTALVKMLTGSTTYQFKVIARIGDSTYLSLDDATVINVTTEAPVATSGITVVEGVVSADLSWEPVEGAVKYWVYKSTSADGPFYIYTSTTETECTAKRLRPDSTYYFKISALTYQNGIDCYSDIADSPLATVNTGSSSIITTALDSNTGSTATISWPAFENADKYWVMYSTTTSDTTLTDEWTTYTSTTATSYTFKNLTPNTVYYLNVCARYTDGDSVATINYLPITVRTAYSDTNVITFTENSSTSVTLTWADDITDVQKTWVYAIDSEGNETLLKSTTTNTVTISLSNFKNYSYSLKVLDVNGVYGYLTPTGGEAYHN